LVQPPLNRIIKHSFPDTRWPTKHIDSAPSAAVCDVIQSQNPKPSFYFSLKESLSLSVKKTSSLPTTTFRNLPFYLSPSVAIWTSEMGEK